MQLSNFLINVKHKVSILLTIGIYLISLSSAHAEEPQVTAELNSQVFSVDSAAQLTVIVTGARSVKLKVPEVEGLIIHNRGTSKSFQSINGKNSFISSTRYIVQSLSPGKYTIPPIIAEVKGKRLQTEPISIDVLPSNSVPQQNKSSKTLTTTNTDDPNSNKVAYIRLLPKKKKGYVGEMIPVQVKAFFRTDLDGLALPVLHGDGFVMPALSENPSQKREVINGQQYVVITWDTTLSGVKEGEYSLFMTLDATLLLRRPRKTSSFSNNDPFGSRLFDDFFSGGFQRKNAKLESQTVSLTVLPLPVENQPDDFSGAIGTFSLVANAKPQTIDLGEPVTLNLEISGDGNFDRVQCPTFPDIQNFKTYQPSTEFYQAQKVKVFERAIIPKSTAVNEIPAHNFTFFDPDKEEYVTISSAAIPLNIKSSQQPPNTTQQSIATGQVSTSSNPTIQEAKGIQPASTSMITGLAPQKLESGNFHNDLTHTYKKMWFKTIVVICSLLIFVFAALHFRKRKQQNNPQMVKKRKVRGELKRNLHELEQLKSSGNVDAILSSGRKTIQQHLGYLWDTEPSAITLTDLIKNLGEKSPLVALFQKAEQGAYGGVHLTDQAVDDYITAIKTELEKL